MSSPERSDRRERRGGRRAARILGSVLYWVVVIVISLALVAGLILLLESRDESEIEGAQRDAPAMASPAASAPEAARASG